MARHWRLRIGVGALALFAGVGSLPGAASAGVRTTGGQTIRLSVAGCTETFGWTADSAIHRIDIGYTIDCATPTNIVASIELDEDGLGVAGVRTSGLTHDLLENVVTHDERSTSYPFAKPGRVYDVMFSFSTYSPPSPVPPGLVPYGVGSAPGCFVGPGRQSCSYDLPVTVPFTEPVSDGPTVALPTTFAGTATTSGTRVCTFSLDAQATGTGGLGAQGVTSCPWGWPTHGELRIYADSRELGLLAAGEEYYTSLGANGNSSQAQVPLVVPGRTYTVVYVTHVETAFGYGWDNFVSAPPGCVINGLFGTSALTCEIAVNVTA